MKTNYHTHTYRCKHAVGDDEAFILSAIAGGFDEVGFSDHSPWPYVTPYRSDIRMDMFLLDDYVNNLKRLREKYAGKISVKIGLECEYYEQYIPWLTDTVARCGLDYLLFGNHFSHSEEKGDAAYLGHACNTPEWLEEYGKSALAGINSGVFTCVAHPDLFMRTYPVFDNYAEKLSHEICRACAAMDLPVEYNISGYEYAKTAPTGFCFPFPEFWKIAAGYRLKAVIGCDAHNRTTMRNPVPYARAIDELESLGIERLEQLPFITSEQ